MSTVFLFVYQCILFLLFDLVGVCHSLKKLTSEIDVPIKDVRTSLIHTPISEVYLSGRLILDWKNYTCITYFYNWLNQLWPLNDIIEELTASSVKANTLCTIFCQQCIAFLWQILIWTIWKLNNELKNFQDVPEWYVHVLLPGNQFFSSICN